jgi:DNA-binding transcriptional MerR regulator
MDNGYREYRPADVDHLRLLVDLRRMEIPLDDAARMAGWCHAGHCAETSQELPQLIAGKRAEISERVTRLRHLDERLAELERHLGRPRRSLTVLAESGPCCEAAEAVMKTGEAASCACCAN